MKKGHHTARHRTSSAPARQSDALIAATLSNAFPTQLLFSAGGDQKTVLPPKNHVRIIAKYRF
jgi:hypothetical protein